MKNLHTLVKSTRNKLGWSMEELAQKAGVSKTVIVSIENQQSDPKVGTIMKICQAMGLPIWKVFMEEDREEILSLISKTLEAKLSFVPTHISDMFQSNDVLTSIIVEVETLLNKHRFMDYDAVRSLQGSFYGQLWNPGITWSDTEKHEIQTAILHLFEGKDIQSLKLMLESLRQFAMKDDKSAVTRHVHYTFEDRDNLIRKDYIFTSPCIAELDGMDDDVLSYWQEDRRRYRQFYPDETVKRKSNSKHNLVIQEKVSSGDVVSFQLFRDHDIQTLVVRDSDKVKLLYRGKTFIVWIRASCDGILVIQGNHEVDTHQRFQALQVALGPLSLKDQVNMPSIRGLTDIDVQRHPSTMDHQTAADYVGLTVDTLYKRVANNEITRDGGFLYRKEELDRYLLSKLEGPAE